MSARDIPSKQQVTERQNTAKATFFAGAQVFPKLAINKSNVLQRQETPLMLSAQDKVAIATPVLERQLQKHQGKGQQLPKPVNEQMSGAFGEDFSDVSIHTGNQAAEMSRGINARAFTHGSDIYFSRGQFRPGSFAGDQLLAHELTHVVQQKKNAGSGISRSVLSDQARATWTASQQNKGAIFDLLRTNSPSVDADLLAFVQSIFTAGSDDLWLAETILRNGPEPLWPLADITERQRRATANNWAPEPGNIAGTLGTGSHTVQAFYFRGTSDRRALIIGGVHGSEAGGVEVVHHLLDLMRAPNAPMPFFSVIIVPELFAANLQAGNRLSGGRVRAMAGGQATRVSTPDPNRQFPAVGADPTRDATLGCVVDEQQRCIEPENLVLLDLVNRFQPERVASAHGHSVVTSRQKLLTDGGPSITTDPRPGHVADDDALALAMAQEANRRGVRVPGNFIGTADETTRYPTVTAPRVSRGVTFGQWGSHATPTRPAMNIILIETYGNRTSASGSAAQRARRRTELMNLADILRNFFLVDPATLVPTPGPATPAAPATAPPAKP